MFIGVDTAIMHLAAANDVPVIALFGPSGAFEWGPWDNDLDANDYTQRNGNQTMGKQLWRRRTSPPRVRRFQPLGGFSLKSSASM